MTRALAIQMGVGAMVGMAGATLLVRARRAVSEPAHSAWGIADMIGLFSGGFATVFYSTAVG
ncbi:hypothetical protein ACPVPU_06405 [Sphingomonas sp. CJ99]